VGKSVIIVESPAKTRTIGHFVGPEYELAASMGHVRDLPARELGVDVDRGFAPEYEPIAGKQKTVAALRRATKGADAVYLATDPDREGEAIAWHLAELLGLKSPRRIEFNEITRSAVQAALRHPREIDLARVDAQQARRVLDRLVGYRLSPLLWRKVKQGLSAGRVQSVAVRLIVDREREIEAFTPEEYWSVDADLTPLDREAPFRARLIERAGRKLKIENEEQARAVEADLRERAFSVAAIERKDQWRKPPPPHITSTLQQDAARRLGFSARKTMTVAQQLYEGLEIGDEGSVGLITYMRTDSVRVAKEAQAEAREVIAEAFGNDYLPERPPAYRSRRGAQEAHEAVRPTSVARRPEQVKQYLDKDQLNLYQ
jgi:DNA topoisomerase-1